MRGYNSLLGSHYDHYYLIYDYYDTSEISPETFEIDSGKYFRKSLKYGTVNSNFFPDMTCSAFPGPGDRHLYTFNPMREFIHPSSDSHLSFEFDKFTRKHVRQYKNKTEHTYRKEIFRQNLRFIHSMNRKSKSNFAAEMITK